MELIRRDSRKILWLQKFQCRKFLDKVMTSFESWIHSMKIDKTSYNHESLLSTKDKPLQIMIIIHSCMEIHFRFSTIRIQITNILSRECKYHHKFRWRRKIYQKTSVTWPFSLLVLCTHSHLIFLLIQSSINHSFISHLSRSDPFKFYLCLWINSMGLDVFHQCSLPPFLQSNRPHKTSAR